ncbi:MAG: ribosome-associated translation inhibitor RaiA [Candidatus Staskawiczbacteria bacterium]|nr:ribosome-associated translation inhibitor RaiA [Candidatus Staskawiczbacteria bacterium]
MKIIIKAKNLEQSEALNKFIEEKFFTLKKFIDILKRPDEGKTLAEVFVEVEKESRHHRKGEIFLVKAQAILPGRSIMAEAKEEDLFKAVIAARDELRMEIEKYKVKKVDKNRREQRKAKTEIER